MHWQDLVDLVSHGESDQLEVKKSTGQRTVAMKSVCAMLNGVGGFVLFGIADGGEIVGQRISTRTFEDIEGELAKIEPQAAVTTETIPIASDQFVIALRVSGGSGPFTYDGRAYQRHGPTTRPMSQQRYQQLLLERLQPADRWENLPARMAVEELDAGEIQRTVEESVRRGRIAEPGTRDPVHLLRGLGLMRDGELLNAATVLFAQSERLLPTYAQCLLRMARFRGVDKTEFLDNRQEVGNIFELLVIAQRFLRDHLPVAGRIVPNLFERVDDPLYPPEA